MNDIEVILRALGKERDEIHQQLMQLDRIIKRVKSGTYEGGNIDAQPLKQLQAEVTPHKPKSLSPSNNLKIEVLRIFDVVGIAATLRQIQTEYKAISGNNIQLRETIRSLHKASKLMMLRDKTASRGMMWVKSEWVENGQLMDKHKPEGFDLLYKQENLVFE